MHTPSSAQSAVEEVLAILHRLLEQAEECEASMGTMPGADEALAQAIVETKEILTRLTTTPPQAQ